MNGEVTQYNKLNFAAVTGGIAAIGVAIALRTGYRYINTAAAYGNEREVDSAIRDSGVDRSEVFIETKVWISGYGYDATLHAFDKSGKARRRPARPTDPAPGSAHQLRPDDRGLPGARLR